MAINKNINTRFTFTLDKKLKEEIIKISEEDRRSVSNLMAWILDRYVKERKKQGQEQ